VGHVNGRPRLGYVLKRFPRISETFVAAELIELERQGERVTVFAISRPDESFVHAFLDELRALVVYLPHRPLGEPLRTARALAGVLRASPQGWLRAALAALSTPRQILAWRRLLQATVLREELTRAGIEHVHAHFATAAARLANLAHLMDGPPYSVTAHAKDIYHRRACPRRLREKLGDAAFVATVSEANHAHLTAVMGDRGRVEVVPNSADLRRLGSPNGVPRRHGLVLAVARLVEKKGLEYLIEACGLLAARGTAARLAIVGDGPLRARLERLSDRVAADVVFHGALPQEQVLPLYRRAAVVCLPCVVVSTGDRDGLPTSLLEAMALGAPVVSTRVGGIGELVRHEETGLLVPERDPEALADALERLLTDRSLAAALAGAGREHVEAHFSLERSVFELRALFGEAVA
jgi:colanic acid/amylovoran biosynthesis glycosyltransferase